MLSLRMTSPLDCPTVYSDLVNDRAYKQSKRRHSTDIHPKGTTRHQTSSMTHHTPMSIQVKFTSKVQKMTSGKRLRLLMKSKERQKDIMI